jgi:hypothetical protein
MLERLEADTDVAALGRRVGISVWHYPSEDNSFHSLDGEAITSHTLTTIDDGVVKYATKQTEIGTVGTKTIDGKLVVEKNVLLRPYYARGRNGEPGLLEEVYRTDPIVFNSLNEITALVTNATYEPQIPRGADDELIELMQRAHRSILNVQGGFDTFVENASTAFKLGFAVHEAQWQTSDDGFISLYALRFREQSTVYRWLFDDKQRELVGADFQLLGTDSSISAYTLPAGERQSTARLVLTNINAYGNNVEGIAPSRVAYGLINLKKLLLQISGVSFQKYGVPIATIVRELADASASVLAELGSAENQHEMQLIVNRLQNMRAGLAPVLPVPIGAKLEYQTPTNNIPDVTPMLQYLDQMIALCFSNEGAILGSGFGSYALAKVQDDKFMRAAPVYAKRIAKTLSYLMRMMILWNHSDPESIAIMPKYGFRFAGTQDSSAWTRDMAVLVQSRVWDWPIEARRQAAVNMGLSADAFNTWGIREAVKDGEEPTQQIPLPTDAADPDEVSEGNKRAAVGLNEFANKSDSFKPPKDVQEAAARGLELRRENGGKGGESVGVARARDLSNGKNISYETIKEMAGWFPRHRKNKAGNRRTDEGYIAWMLWGGDAGERWANSIVRRVEGSE